MAESPRTTDCLAGSFFSAYVATGSFNRSGTNYDAGARTPVAAILAGLLLVVLVLLVAPVTAYLPHAAMAGLLFMVAWRLIDFRHIRTIARADRKETMVMVVTFFGTPFLDLEFAILLGVMLSLMIYLRRTSRQGFCPGFPVRPRLTASSRPASTCRNAPNSRSSE